MSLLVPAQHILIVEDNIVTFCVKHMLRSITIVRVGLRRVVVRYTTDALAHFNSSPSVYTATQAIKVQTDVGKAIDIYKKLVKLAKPNKFVLNTMISLLRKNSQYHFVPALVQDAISNKIEDKHTLSSLYILTTKMDDIPLACSLFRYIGDIGVVCFYCASDCSLTNKHSIIRLVF